VSQFRATFLGPGANLISTTPGAHDALALVRSLGGRAAVITSRLPHIAERMLTACNLTADILFGGLTGLEKTSAMRETRISCYVGDHPLDMVGAQAADVYGIGVLTGFHNETILRQAGASLVLADLASFGRDSRRYFSGSRSFAGQVGHVASTKAGGPRARSVRGE
jgi:phosphoglycolate phosphatase